MVKDPRKHAIGSTFVTLLFIFSHIIFRFVSIFSLRKHQLEVHNVHENEAVFMDGMFGCVTCGRRFTLWKQLKVHRYAAHGRYCVKVSGVSVSIELELELLIGFAFFLSCLELRSPLRLHPVRPSAPL